MPHCPVTVVQRYRDGVCSLLFHLFFIICHPYIPLHLIFIPRRACARVTGAPRVTALVLCVCLCVYPSFPATESVETSEQRYSRVSLRNQIGGFSKNPSVRKLQREKKQYANELELTVSRFRAVSGPTKHSSYAEGNWWVECCFKSDRKNPSVRKLQREKKKYANELELTVSLFRAVSGLTKHSSYAEGNWWVECCFRG